RGFGEDFYALLSFTGQQYNFILPHVPHREEFGYGMVILETVVILSITYLITYMLEKNKLTRSLMLGSR
ncbi:hypothetical protein, partial [Prevotella corporis]|uniref:hypothetical protein n=1 Tax=Prevotella corporis TaxID=28128 RepID=UPI0023F04FAE